MNGFEKFFTYYEGMSDEAVGGYSATHLIMVSVAFVLYIGLGILVGKLYKGNKINVLRWTGIIMLTFELIKIICNIVSYGWGQLLYCLPLFLCSTFLIILPLISFTSGLFQQGMIDFIYIFGVFSSIMGTFLAANIYGYYPVFHVHIISSLLTHSCAGFAWSYIATTKMYEMKKRTLPHTLGTLTIAIVLALVVDILMGGVNSPNYMFLFRDDGTPFIVLSMLFGTGTVGYTISIIVLQVVLVPCSYLRVKLMRRIAENRRLKKEAHAVV